MPGGGRVKRKAGSRTLREQWNTRRLRRPLAGNIFSFNINKKGEIIRTSPLYYRYFSPGHCGKQALQ